MLNKIDLDQILDEALACHQAGQFDDAEARYRSVLRHNPNEPDGLNLLGALLQERGQLAESIALLTRALEIDADFPEALTNLARAQRATDASGAAIESARRAITLDPELAEAHLQLGRALLDQGDNPAAVASLRRAASLAPQSIDAHSHLGIALMQSNEGEAALGALSAVIALDPSRVEAMVLHGVVLESLNRLDEASHWHEQAARCAPNDPSAHAALAVTKSRQKDPVASMAACRRALDLAPNRIDMWQLLGGNHAALGNFVEAECCWRKVLDLNPSAAGAQRGLAEIGRQAEGEAELRRLRAVLDDAGSPLTERITAGFAVGATCDRNSDYDEAFSAFERANTLSRAREIKAGRGFDRDMLRKYVDWASVTFSPTLFAATADWGDPSEHPVFIVGMPRSGTSLVEQIAASHRQVHGAGERKDIREIVRTLDGGAAHRSPKDWSRPAVRAAASAQITQLENLGDGAERVIDKLPDNIQMLGQIAVLFPNARVVVCRRDPRDICLSCYFQQFAEGLAWTLDQSDLAFRARQITRLLDHWRSVLPLRLIEIDYETLVGDLEGEGRRLIAFLGLEWDPNCLAFEKTARPVTTASYWQVRQPVYTNSVGRWRHYRRHLAPLLQELEGLAPADD
jgi:tetratricopeptide (TPR) repeat protein